MGRGGGGHTYTHSRQGTTFCATIQRVENLLQPPQVWLKPTHSIVVIWVKIFKTEKTIEIHVVRLTDVRGKVRSEKYAYKSVKRALLLSNVIDADHQKSCFLYIYKNLWEPKVVCKIRAS